MISSADTRPYTVRDFKIVDETPDYLVVDKPPFLLAHPTKPDGPPTLWKELRELLAFEIANGGQISIVNRLGLHARAWPRAPQRHGARAPG